MYDVVRKRLHLRAYKLQFLYEIVPTDKNKRFEFAADFLLRIDDDDNF